MFDFHQEAFRASGLSNKTQIKDWMEKLDYMAGQFLSSCDLESQPMEKARLLFQWLWKDRPDRYRRHGNFRLHHVIRAQADRQACSVGNCLGLTLLYNCLLLRIGISPKAIYLENAFDRGPHLLTHLKIDKLSLDVDNIFTHGFNYKGHLNDPARIIWGDREIVGEIYHSAGNELFEKGSFRAALQNYTTALEMNPRHEKVRLNMKILMERIKEDN